MNIALDTYYRSFISLRSIQDDKKRKKHILKTAPKILKTTFLIVFILQMLGLIFLLAVPNLTQAADTIKFIPQVGIPNSEFSDAKIQEMQNCLKNCDSQYQDDDKKKEKCKKDKCGLTVGENTIGYYIQAIYKYAIGIIGILAAVVLMIGGVIWITAGGNQTRIGEAKAWIGASLTGLIIALTSYMILATVNPALVNFRPINVTPIDKATIACLPEGASSKDANKCCSGEIDLQYNTCTLKTGDGVCKNDNQCPNINEYCDYSYGVNQCVARRTTGSCHRDAECAENYKCAGTGIKYCSYVGSY